MRRSEQIRSEVQILDEGFSHFQQPTWFLSSWGATEGQLGEAQLDQPAALTGAGPEIYFP